MKDFFVWVAAGFGKWVLVILAIAAILPVLALGCDIGTELLTGEYFPEGTYVVCQNYMEPSEFTFVKDAQHRKGSLLEGHYYTMKSENSSFCTFYAWGAMHFHPGIESYVATETGNILHRDGDIFYVTEGSTKAKTIWLAPKDNEEAVNRIKAMFGYTD